MQQFKIDHFKREHPEVQFSSIQQLNLAQCTELLTKLTQHVANVEGHQPLGLSLSKAPLVEGVDAESSDFNVASVFQLLRVLPQTSVFILWVGYSDKITQMEYAVFASYFENIWYPSSDDIVVFDSSFNWVLVITHEGEVRFRDLTN